MVQLLIVNVPLLLMPPPRLAVGNTPLVIVNPEMMTTGTGGPLVIVKMRKFVPAPLLRSTVSRFAPGPWIVMSVVIPASAVRRLMVAGPPDVNAGANVMVSAPASALAALIASRNVQPSPMPIAVHGPSPGSASELTSNVVKSSLKKVTVAVLVGFTDVLPLPAASVAAAAGMVIVTAPLLVMPSTATL